MVVLAVTRARGGEPRKPSSSYDNGRYRKNVVVRRDVTNKFDSWHTNVVRTYNVARRRP
jgi:hypothetical protein